MTNGSFPALSASWDDTLASPEPAKLEVLLRNLASAFPAALEFAAQHGKELLTEVVRRLCPRSARLGEPEIALALAAEAALTAVGQALPAGSWQAFDELATLPGRLGLTAEALRQLAGGPDSSLYVASAGSLSVADIFALPPEKVVLRVWGALARILFQEARTFVLAKLEDRSDPGRKACMQCFRLVPEAQKLRMLAQKGSAAKQVAPTLERAQQPSSGRPASTPHTNRELSPVARQVMGLLPAEELIPADQYLAKELAYFVSAPCPMPLGPYPELGAALKDWLLLRLGMAEAGPSGTAPELLGDIEELETAGGRHHLLRLAMADSELWAERRLAPAANLLKAWSVAQHLLVESPATFWLICADLEWDAIELPKLAPGELHFGEILFGFRLLETEASSEARDPQALAMPSHLRQLWIDGGSEVATWLASCSTLMELTFLKDRPANARVFVKKVSLPNVSSETLTASWEEVLASPEPAKLEDFLQSLTSGSRAALEFAAQHGKELLTEVVRRLCPRSARLGEPEIALAFAAEAALTAVGQALPAGSWQAFDELATLPGRLGLTAEALRKLAGGPDSSLYHLSGDSLAVDKIFNLWPEELTNRVLGALVRILLADEEVRPFLLEKLIDESYLELKAAIFSLSLVPEARSLFLDQLSHSSGIGRRHALKALVLHASQPPTADLIPYLTRALEDPSEQIRYLAVEALFEVDDARDLLRQRLEDPDKNVRNLAAKALGLPHEPVIRKIRKLKVRARQVPDASSTAKPQTNRDLSAVARQVAGLRPAEEATASERHLAAELASFLVAPAPLTKPHAELEAALLDWFLLRLGMAEPGLSSGSAGEFFGDLAETETADARVYKLRLAMADKDLWAERRVLPTANLLRAWAVARYLRAEKPTTFWLICADLDWDAIKLPQLLPGELHFGDTFFGFRLPEAKPVEELDLLTLAAPSHGRQLWLDQSFDVSRWLASCRMLTGRPDFATWPFLMRPRKPFVPRLPKREIAREVRLQIEIERRGDEGSRHLCGKRRSGLPSPMCPSCEEEMLCIFSLDGSDPALAGTALGEAGGDWDVFVCTGACNMHLGGYFTRPLADGTIEVREVQEGEDERFKDDPPELPYSVFPVRLVPLEPGTEFRSGTEQYGHDHRVSPYLFDDKQFHLRDLSCPFCEGRMEQAMILDSEHRLELRYTFEWAGGNYVALCICQPCRATGYFVAYD